VSLNLLGGKKGLLQNSTSLCSADQKALAAISDQSGRSITRRVLLQLSCAKERRGRMGAHRSARLKVHR
jgi:hypothetical protein